MAGRIESYIHSDAHTKNKGGILMEIATQTDFAARNEDFIEFCKRAAKMAYAAKDELWLDDENNYWHKVARTFPDIEGERKELSFRLREEIEIRQVRIIELTSDDTLAKERAGVH